MKKTFRVREIRKYTGLSRKQLYDYVKSIPPIGTENDAGYKLYDHEGLEKLSMAALFAELGAGPQRINDIFGAGDFDRKKAMDDLLYEAEEKRRHLDDIITVARIYKEMDAMVLPFNPFQIQGLHETAEAVRAELKSADTKKLIDMDKKDGHRLLEIFREFKEYAENGIKPDGAGDQVEKLINFFCDGIGAENWARILSGHTALLISSSEYIDYVEKDVGNGVAEYISSAIIEYQMSGFLDDMEKELSDTLDDVIGMDYSAPEVGTLVLIFMVLMERWFGYTSFAEGLTLIQSARYASGHYEDDEYVRESFDYLYDTLSYYDRKERIELKNDPSPVQ